MMVRRTGGERASYDALKAGKWDDTSIWFDDLQSPPTPSGPPAAGDIAVVDALFIGSGSQMTGTASVQTLMISNSDTAAAALTFNGSFTASSDIDLTSTPGPTPAPFTVTLIGAFSELLTKNWATVASGADEVCSGKLSNSLCEVLTQLVQNRGSTPSKTRG